MLIDSSTSGEVDTSSPLILASGDSKLCSGVALCSRDGAAVNDETDAVADTEGVILGDPVFHKIKLSQAVSDGVLLLEIEPFTLSDTRPLFELVAIKLRLGELLKV